MKLKNFNLFRKLPDDLQLGSWFGITFSVSSFLVIIMLIVCEWNSYLKVNLKSSVKLDSHEEDTFRINFNVTMTSIPCRYASVDLSDDMGARFVNITHNVRRWRTQLNTDGEIQRLEEVAQTFEGDNDYSHEVHPGEEFAELLTDASYEEFMTKYNMVVVNYFAPWCPWCQKLEPIWEHVAAQMLDHPEFSEKVRLAKVDCTAIKSKILCRRARIQAFPSILIYFGGNVNTRYMYNGPRATSAIMLFLEVFYRRMNQAQLEQLKLNINEIQMDEADRNFVPRLHQDLTQTEMLEHSKEGCQLYGSLSVNRVPGKLVFTARSGGHSIDFSSIDITHIVHSLTFGQPVSSIVLSRLFGYSNFESLLYSYNPSSTLDNIDTSKNIRKKWKQVINTMENSIYELRKSRNVTIEHFLKIVGIDFIPPRYHPHRILTTTQRLYKYTSSTSEYHVTPETRASVIFSYDISPLVVQRKVDNKPFYRFIVSLCAIVGGVYVIFRMLHSSMWFTWTSLQRKRAIGKLN